MTTYTNVFGGTVVYPSEVSYRAVTLTADTQLSWPTELATDTNVVAQIMDVTANAGPLKLKMPSAIDASVGETTLIFNVGSNDFTVTDTNANTIVSIAPGLAYQIYLTDNTTASGSWRSVQYGAGSSSATAGSLAGQGIKAIGTTLNQSMSVFTFSVNYTLGVASDRSALYVWTGGAGTISLPLASDAGNDWFVQVRNSGTGALTVDPAGVDLINGSSSLVLNPGDSAIIACSGSAWFTIGLGKSASFTFDYNSINLTGQPDPYTLSGANLNRIAYNFGGTLTANFTVIVPTTIQQYWVTNSTSGGFSITVRPAAGAGIAVAAGESAILYCDGVNVVDADTSGIAFPISVANGGTGATNATDARTNLSAAKSGVNADITSITALSAGGASGPAVTFAADPDSGMYSAGANQLGFSVNGVNAMTLTTSGMNLANALSVALGAAATPSYTFTGDLNTGFWSPGADILAASTGGSERMRITSAGYVGIGTSAPGFELDVKGAGATTSARIVGGGITTPPASGGTLTIHTLTQGVARTGLDVSFTDGVGSRMGGFKFSDTQTAGDWTSCQLEMVQSFGAANEIVSKLQVESASWAGMRFVSQTNAGAALATSPTFIWRNYTTEQMRVTAAGDVGIGTASPSSKLHVAGALTLDTALSAANGGTGATSLTGLVVGNGTSAFTTVTAPSGAVVGTTDAQTLTNKRVTPRMNSAASTTSPWAWNSDSYDEQAFTALANALTINADAGTPTDGQRTIFRFKDNGTPRALTWTTGSTNSFRAVGVTLPTTTVTSKIVYIGCIYNAADSRWDVIAVAQEA